MFNLGKTINTKIDHIAVFKRAIDKSISEAADGHVSTREIVSYLRSRAQWLEDAAYMAPATATIPKTYDGYGRPIDLAAKIDEAQRERERKANEASVIPPHLRQSAASGYRK